MQSLSSSRLSSPPLGLDLGSHADSRLDVFRGLQFPHPPPRAPGIGTMAPGDRTKEHAVNTRVLQAMWLIQAMMVIVLTLLITGLLYWSYVVNHNVTWYYGAAQPYLAELKTRGMSMVRHADNSSAALEQVMDGAKALSSTAIPALMESVNRTSAMVARLEQVARNPTIKLSMA